jgi:hypothetical protein
MPFNKYGSINSGYGILGQDGAIVADDTIVAGTSLSWDYNVNNLTVQADVSTDGYKVLAGGLVRIEGLGSCISRMGNSTTSISAGAATSAGTLGGGLAGGAGRNAANPGGTGNAGVGETSTGLGGSGGASGTYGATIYAGGNNVWNDAYGSIFQKHIANLGAGYYLNALVPTWKAIVGGGGGGGGTSEQVGGAVAGGGGGGGGGGGVVLIADPQISIGIDAFISVRGGDGAGGQVGTGTAVVNAAGGGGGGGGVVILVCNELVVAAGAGNAVDIDGGAGGAGIGTGTAGVAGSSGKILLFSERGIWLYTSSIAFGATEKRYPLI